jgi:hypothetical protein
VYPVLTVTFATAYASTPSIIIQQAGAHGTTTAFFVYNPSTTGFSIYSYGVLSASQAAGYFQMNYIVVG